MLLPASFPLYAAVKWLPSRLPLKDTSDASSCSVSFSTSRRLRLAAQGESDNRAACHVDAAARCHAGALAPIHAGIGHRQRSSQADLLRKIFAAVNPFEGLLPHATRGAHLNVVDALAVVVHARRERERCVQGCCLHGIRAHALLRNRDSAAVQLHARAVARRINRDLDSA